MLNGKHLQTVKLSDKLYQIKDLKRFVKKCFPKNYLKIFRDDSGLQFLPNKMLKPAEFKSELQVVWNTKCRINYIRWGERWE